MTRGRKPKATSVAEQDGSYKKNPSRRPKNIINGDPRLPVAPDFVKADDVAIKVWNETVEVLKSTGILSKTDTHLLVQYVTTYSEWQRAYVHVSANGHTDKDTGKVSVQSMTLHKLSDRHIKLLAELGLSPSSRARLSVATSDVKEEQGTSLASIISAMKGDK